MSITTGELKDANEIHELLQELINTEEKYAQAKARFVARASKMSWAVKCQVDRLLVKRIESIYRTKAHVSKRPMLSGWTFEDEAARQSLSRARKFLRT